MKKSQYLFSVLCLLLVVFFSMPVWAQTVSLSGVVKDNTTKEVVPVVSVTIKGFGAGTYSDDKGFFQLTTSEKLPLVLVFSSIGYETKEVNVTSANLTLEVFLDQSTELGQEVVVSASRFAQRILESPVSIERVSSVNIRNAPSASYYDVISTLKGVDVVTSSLTFKTPTTRGFNGSGNVRFNQIVDGMDNQAPGLNFSVGSVVGLTQLDVESMELLPGASSALYGPGGMNGTLLINSKNPFKHQGLSFEIKTGVMHVDGRQRPASPYYNWSVRYAQKVSEKFAWKITSEFVQAQDWAGMDDRNFERLGTDGFPKAGNRQTDPNYDGINLYGDETTVDIRPFLQGIGQQAPFLAPFINTLIADPIDVSRTGYSERDIIDPTTLNYKIGGSLNYKLSEKTEAILAGHWGTGNTVYTGSDRYSLKDLKIGQYKLELVNPRWLLRAYTTQENAGQSFNATVATRLTNELWKPSVTTTNGNPTPQLSDWYVQYSQAFLNNKLNGFSDQDAHNSARGVADVGRPEAGSAEFKQLFNQIRSVPISQGGGLFVDKTNLYNVEGQYNLSDITGNFADILVGANYKKYVLNSEGTLFADSAGKIGINEYGAYVQAMKGLFNDVVSLTVSGRYDKNSNFTGRFTPRATALIKVAKNNNIRLSYQTAYRFPSTQQQWINLDVGGGVRLLGGVPAFRDFYKMESNPVYTLESVEAGNPQVYQFPTFKPESVTSYEAGYKGLLFNGKLLIDLYGYLGQYTNFLTRRLVVQSRTGSPAGLGNASTRDIYSIPYNVPEKVKSYGYGISLDYRLPQGFGIGVNGSSDVLDALPEDAISFFNSPKYRFNGSFSNAGFGPKDMFGFNVTYRWQDSFFYQGDFASGIVPAFHTVDAQISTRITRINSIVKLGANNLLNQYYVNAIGNAQVGGLYYISFGYNL